MNKFAFFHTTNYEYVYFTPTLLKMFDLTLNQKTKGTLTAMLKDELLEKGEASQNEDELPQYKLTEKGFYEICLEFPSFRLLWDEWDGMWRIISYEIPE